MISYMGNKGTFSFSPKHTFKDFELLYHLGYFTLCFMGLFGHEFFYSLLVRTQFDLTR